MSDWASSTTLASRCHMRTFGDTGAERDDDEPPTIPRHAARRPTAALSRRPGTFRLGKVAGVEVRLDFTLILVFFLVAGSLGNHTLPAWHPDWPSSLIWGVALGAATLFFASVLAHEMSHALVARAQGMRVSGITLFMFGGVTEIVGEPPSPRAEFLMAIVGPLTSIAIGILAIIGGRAFVNASPDFMAQHPEAVFASVAPLGTLLIWLGPINLLLGFFNLVPGFPLDGGRVLRSIIWAITKDLEKATVWAAGVGQILAWLLVATGVFIAFGGVVPFFGRGLFQGLWLILIGWFLSSAARMSAARVTEMGALRGVPVRSLMVSRVEVLDPDERLEAAVKDTVLKTDQSSFPVVSHGELVGLVGIREMQAVRDRWPEVRVRDVMLPAEQITKIAADSDAAEAVTELADHSVNQVAVVDKGSFLGLLRREDIVRWLAFHPVGARS
jgi:Zn-dependent protease/CBS domain-containing protein